MESAILYTCWKKLPRIIGIANTVNAFRGASVIKYSSFAVTLHCLPSFPADFIPPQNRSNILSR